MAECLIKVITNKELRQFLGINGYITVDKHFSEESMAKKCIDIYKEIITLKY